MADAKTIRVPATPRSAYDPNRPANALLLTHARELERAVAEAGRSVRRKKPRTEGQVAAYIRHLNRALHQQVLLPNMKRRPLDVPLDDVAPARPRRKKKTAKKKAAPSRQRKRSRRR